MDDRQNATEATHALLNQRPDLAAIYNVGGGTSGIALALKACNLNHKVVLIAREATESNKRLLRDGTVDAVVDQNPRVAACEALNILTAAARGKPIPSFPCVWR